MKGKRAMATLVAVAMLLSSGIALSGCATKRQLSDLETKVDQALSDARSAKASAADATAQVKKAEAAADRADKAAIGAENAAKRAEAMANKSEAVFMQKMKK
jgi:hypothetical protein